MALIAAAAAARPLVASGQGAAKVWRIGLLETIPAEQNAANVDAFRKGLRELGHVEGRNLIIDYRSVDGRPDRFPELAAELIRRGAEVIVTRGTPAVIAARAATATIPIVMAASAEPLGAGVIAELARPGGNVTGLSAFVVELEPKRIELLREVVPGIARIGALYNMSNPISAPRWELMSRTARSLGIEPRLFDIRNADDLGAAFAAAESGRVDALVTGLDAVILANRQAIVELAARHRRPVIYASREFVAAGGLISYNTSFPHLYFRAASYVDRIIKGAKPGDLPVEQPTTFELAVNLNAAKALGIAIPESILIRADEVIE